MRTFTRLVKLIAHGLGIAARTLGGMGGAKTFDHDNATALYKSNDEYRP